MSIIWNLIFLRKETPNKHTWDWCKGSSIDSSFCQIQKTPFSRVSLYFPGHDWWWFFWWDKSTAYVSSIILFFFFLYNYIFTCNYYAENNFSAVSWIFLVLFHVWCNGNEIVGAKQNFRLALKLIPANSNMFKITRFATLVLGVILLGSLLLLCPFCHTVHGSNYYRECLTFCNLWVIQKDLDSSKYIHNNHCIRRYPNQECPNGKPGMLYNVPELYGKFKWIKWCIWCFKFYQILP